MKRIFLFLSFVTFLNPSFAQKDLAAKASVESATVYLSGAELSSTVKVNIPTPGVHDIIIENLPSSAQGNTFQVLTNSPAVTILSAVFQVNHLKGKDLNPEYIKLKDSLELLKLEHSRLANQRVAYQEEQNMILSNKVVSGANTGLSVLELQKNADFFRNRLVQIKNEISALDVKERKVNERISKFQLQINKFENIYNRPLGELKLQVEASAAGTPSFKISYFMPYASWNPVYDIRVKDISQQPQLEYKAEVSQSSGLDWKDIKLIISSSNPTISGAKPELNPWYLSLYTPRKHHGYKSKTRSVTSSESYQMDEPAPAAKSEEGAYAAQVPSVTVTEAQMSVLFDIKQTYNIPTDGQKHLVNLSKHELKASYQYYAVPKLDKDAFLLARVTEWEGLQLLPGDANVFFENAFVGQTHLDPNETEDTLDLSLGRDKKIIVERKIIKDFERVKTIGTNKKQTFAYEISVRNTKSTPIELIIADQVPLSKNSEIEVEKEEMSGASVNPDTGEVRWKTSVQPAETKKFRFVFSVKYPKGKRVNL